MTESFLVFDPILPLGISLTISAFVLGFVVLLELKRRQKFLVARIIASVFLTIGLLGILARPHIPYQTGNTILVTPGTTGKLIDSLRIILPDAEFIQIDSTSSDVSRTIPDIKDNLYVTGFGIPLSEIDYLEGVDFQFVEGELPNGIIEFVSPKNSKLHQRNTIQGTYHSGSDSVWIKLFSPAKVEDSVLLIPNVMSNFSLSFTPRQAGKFLYPIKEVNSKGDILSSNNLPVIVDDFDPINILFLFNYPTSEIRFLKNFLAEQGHRLTLRNQVSNDRYRTEIVNNAPEVRRVDLETLKKFDLVITDQTSIQSFSRAEHSTLKNEIDNGLGLLIMISQLPDRITSHYLDQITFTKILSDTVSLSLGRNDIRALASPLRSAGAQSKLATNNGNVVEGYTYSGLGRIGFQLLKDTYAQRLQGKDEIYAELWSPLIRELARRKSQVFKLTPNTKFPIYAGNPYDFEIITAGETPKATQNGITIPLAEKAIVDDWWNGTTWFTETGWHAIDLQDSTKSEIFISNKNEWKSLRIMNQIKAHRKLEGISTLNSSPLRSGRTPVPTWIFYFLFLLGFAFLWLAPKL